MTSTVFGQYLGFVLVILLATLVVGCASGPGRVMLCKALLRPKSAAIHKVSPSDGISLGVTRGGTIPTPFFSTI